MALSKKDLQLLGQQESGDSLAHSNLNWWILNGYDYDICLECNNFSLKNIRTSKNEMHALQRK